MILVNGCQGIGTGWSTYVPNYKTTDIISNLERLLKDEDLVDMVPWYQGFEGTIIPEKSKSEKSNSQVGTRYLTVGKVGYVDEKTRIIRELPIKRSKKGYEKVLEKLKEDIKSRPAVVKVRRTTICL